MDKDKLNTDRKGKILFIDATRIYNQIDRAHREFTPTQIEFISNIVRLYRGEELENNHNSNELLKDSFPNNKYCDVKGLCKIVDFKHIAELNWSLNSGRYVGAKEKDKEDFGEEIKH